jgi:hypothetical protein
MSLWFESFPCNLEKGKLYVVTEFGLRHQKDGIGMP